MTKPVKAKAAAKKVKPVLAWAGNVNDAIDFRPNDYPYSQIYKTRREAREYYGSVIRVEIREVK